VKATLNGKSIEKVITQLEGTKELFEKWFGADLKTEWVFISAVYMENGHSCENCDDYIFSGTEDMVEKLEKIHKDLNKETRFVPIFPILAYYF
jgi:hypothetical protein